MQGNRSSDTTPELALRSALHRAGLRFRKHAAPLPGLRCRADVVFPRERVAVFVDGCFWHGCSEHWTPAGRNTGFWRAKVRVNQERDRRQEAELVTHGWRVIRVWEHEDATAAAERARQIVMDRRSPVGQR